MQIGLKSIVFVLFVTLQGQPQETKPNFSGTWSYQVDRFSRRNEIDRIQQEGSTFKISETFGRADVILTQTYYTDGRESATQAGPNSAVRTAHWDGSLLTLGIKRINNGVVITERVQLALSDDGKVMTKTIHSSELEGMPDTKIEFKKLSDGVRGIGIGDSESTVRHEWGEPKAVEVDGDRTIFVYPREGEKDMIVIFVNGKMTDLTRRNKRQ
jgi:hypothetical protein